MPVYSNRSLGNLSTCHEDIQTLFRKVIVYVDCTILCGHRGKEEQNRLYNLGRSRVVYPNSNHNVYPSIAVDVAPYPINWDDLARFYYFAGIVKGIAFEMGIELRFGGDWDGDLEVKDQNFNDLPHFELLGNK